MRKILTQDFFNRDTSKIARELLGKFLVRKYRGRKIASKILETEAYDGFHDLASHASRGKTHRNRPMFGPPGHWYVYFTYGMHFMLNVVTRERGYPAAVLIRGVSDAAGPGRLTKFFKIDRRFNAKKVRKSSGLWIEDRGVRAKKGLVKTASRVGISYAGPYWTKRQLRFFIPKS